MTYDEHLVGDEANAREAAERDSAALVPVEISDEMVDAYVRAIFSGWYIEMKGEELRQDVRAGLAAVVPLIRAQVAAEHESAPRCPATADPLFINGVRAGECDPHACTKTADHAGPWHTCRCGMAFKFADVIDMGFLSLPAELQAEAERAVSEGQERSEEQK